MNRRLFIKNTAATGIALHLLGSNFIFNQNIMDTTTKPFFKLSLAQWSLHNTIESGKLDARDFAIKAHEMGFEAIEYVSRFYTKEAADPVTFSKLINDLKDKSQKYGVRNLLIMVDGEGALAAADENERNEAVANHYKWIDAAAALGCHSIRVNLYGGPEHDADAWKKAAADGLKKLCSYAASKKLNVIVENHGGLSSNAALLAEVMHMVNLKNCGTLPDFGNFCIKREDNGKWPNPCLNEYDRYRGVAEMMPFAKGVSAKSYDFDDNGNETTIDYLKMLKIVNKAGYTGHIGIEYEGQRLGEEEGIAATRELLLRTAKEIK